MLGEINEALVLYQHKWDTLLACRTNTAFFAELRPTAVGWKVADRTTYTNAVTGLQDQADQIIETWMNGRWVAKLHLRAERLANGTQLIKIMERRPDSSDAIGLDHVDFYAPTELAWNQEVLAAEPDLKWSKERNDIIEGYDWLSVWFDGTEAKIKSDTVLDIVTAELTALNSRIIGE